MLNRVCVSRLGGVAVALSLLAGGSVSLGQATFQLLPTLNPGNVGGGAGLSVSPDGSTVVGYTDSPIGSQAFRWRQGEGMIGLGIPTDWFGEDYTNFSSAAYACSENGDFIVGVVTENENGNLKGFKWTSATGIEDVSVPDFLGCRDVSTDGSVIVGEDYSTGAFINGYYLTADGIMQTGSPNTQRLVWGCSADGTVLAGSQGAFPSEGFIYTDLTGPVGVGDIPGGAANSGFNAISLDGTVAAGFGSDSDVQGRQFQAVRWDATSGIEGIGRLPGRNLSSAFAVNGDGGVIVGNSFNSGDSRSQKGFIWTTGAGILDLEQVLLDQGATGFGGFHIIACEAISRDGLTVAGIAMDNNFNQKAFVAHLSSIPGTNACDPDVNQDGNVDQGDIDYLINVVAGGNNPTNIDPDFDHDGNADQGDIDALINVVAGGDCP